MCRILLIEDDEPLRTALAALLTKIGHVVTEASDGTQGVKLYQQEPTDVVLTDLVMDCQDGIETIVKLRKEFPDVRVIAMSGGSAHSPVYLKMAKHLGAEFILQKPFTSAELCRVIDGVLKTAGADEVQRVIAPIRL